MATRKRAAAKAATKAAAKTAARPTAVMLTETDMRRIKSMARRKRGFTRQDALDVIGGCSTRPTQPRVVPVVLIRRLAQAHGGTPIVERAKGQPTRYRLG